MVFEWDEDKNQSNRVEHNIAFEFALQVFDGRPCITLRGNHLTEERWLQVAEIEGRIVTVVWTPRGEAIRIISARRARNDEKRAYRDKNHGRDPEGTRQ